MLEATQSAQMTRPGRVQAGLSEEARRDVLHRRGTCTERVTHPKRNRSPFRWPLYTLCEQRGAYHTCTTAKPFLVTEGGRSSVLSVPGLSHTCLLGCRRAVMAFPLAPHAI